MSESLGKLSIQKQIAVHACFKELATAVPQKYRGLNRAFQLLELVYRKSPKFQRQPKPKDYRYIRSLFYQAWTKLEKSQAA